MTGTTLTLNGDLSGTGGLTKSGAGTASLGAANTYTGNTVVPTGNALTLAAGSSTA